MPYSKQLWNQYDKNKTIEENIQNDAVITPAKMNHIEDGFSIVEQETKALVDALETVVDSNLTATDEHIVQAAKDVDKTIQDFKQEVNKDILANNQSLVQLEAETDKKFVASDNRITSLEEDVVVKATNQFLNPTLKNGITNWRQAGINAKNLGDEIEATVTNLSTFANQYLSQNFVHTLDHKYYLSIEINPKYSNRFGVYAGANYVIPSNTTPVANQWNKYSVVYKPLNTADLLIITHATDTSYEIGDKYYIKNILKVDLTETFGLGNEPTELQMKRLLKQFPNSWFEGTKNIFLARWALNELRRLDDEKANRKQEEWITPTFTNGATNDVTTPMTYRKDNFDNIELNGRFKPSAAGTTSLIFPLGYKPTKTTRLLVPTNLVTAYAVLVINTAGSLYFEYPYIEIAWIDVSGIRLPIK